MSTPLKLRQFCTAVNCMDGRVQTPVTDYLRQRFDVPYVDMITEPGPNRILAEGSAMDLLASIETRIRISLEHHHSVGIAVAGHHGCAGNPTGEADQRAHTQAAIARLQDLFPDVPMIGLWVDDSWSVREIEAG